MAQKVVTAKLDGDFLDVYSDQGNTAFFELMQDRTDPPSVLMIRTTTTGTLIFRDYFAVRCSSSAEVQLKWDDKEDHPYTNLLDL